MCEAQGFFFSLSDVSPRPVKRHCFAGVKRDGVLRLEVLAHPFCKLHEGFTFLTTGCHDQSLSNLVVWHIGSDAVINPLVPIPCHFIPKNRVSLVLWIVSRVVT